MEEAKKEKELKKNKKKNKVASLLLALALVLTCGVAGTIAQYQKSFSGSSTATVAKFDVNADGLGKTESDDIKLFDTIYDTDGTGNVASDAEVETGKGIAPGTQGYIPVKLSNDSEVDVDYTLGVKLLQNTGIYTSNDADEASINNKYIPLQFAISSTAPTSTQVFDTVFNGAGIIDLSKQTVPGTPADLSLGSQDATTLAVGAATKTSPKTVYICWRWAFTDDTNTSTKAARNKLDTAIGELMQETSSNGTYTSKVNNTTKSFTTPKVVVSVDFTQKD